MTDETDALLPWACGSLAMAARLVPTLAMVSSAIVSDAGQAGLVTSGALPRSLLDEGTAGKASTVWCHQQRLRVVDRLMRP
jgi:hypothetical protein